jgi:hypothetical protein
MGATTTNGDGFGIWLVRRRGRTGSVQEHRTGVQRLEPAGSCRPNPYAAVIRSYSGLDRYASTALQLPHFVMIAGYGCITGPFVTSTTQSETS